MGKRLVYSVIELESVQLNYPTKLCVSWDSWPLEMQWQCVKLALQRLEVQSSDMVNHTL